MSPLRLAAAGDAAGNPHAGAGAGVHRTEERNWADLIPDMIRVIGDMLLSDDVADYVHMRAVCSSWRSFNDKPTWETKYYPRNWVMLFDLHDDDEEDMEEADLAAEAAPPPPQPAQEDENEEEDIEVEAVEALTMLQQAKDEQQQEEEQPMVSRRFVNVRTGAMLRALVPAFEEYGHVHINAEGLHLLYNHQTDRMRLVNPLTGDMAVFPGLSDLEHHWSLEFTAAGVVFDKNVPERPTVVLVVVFVMIPRRYAMMLCAKPDDEHWEIVDTSAMEPNEHGQTLASLQGCLSLQGQFYVPMPNADVLRVELLPHPRLVYAARSDLRDIAVTYLVPSLLDNDAAEDDDVIMVRDFGVGDDMESFGVHFGRGTYRNLDDIGNRTVFVPGVTVHTDRFASIAEVAPPGGSVKINDYIENYIV